MEFKRFALMFPKEEIVTWAARYPLSWDEQALKAGKRILEGDYSRSNLEIIVRWKSERRLALIAENSDEEIADALHLALTAKEPRSAFAVLMGLRGVGTPMASSILTAIDQVRFTIIDYRALEALGAADRDTDMNFYLRYYFPECKQLASEAGVDLRTLDRALWSWSNRSETQLSTSLSVR
jgi:hypothetical protein